MLFLDKYKNNLIKGQISEKDEDDLFLEIESVSSKYLGLLSSAAISKKEMEDLKDYSLLANKLIKHKIYSAYPNILDSINILNKITESLNQKQIGVEFYSLFGKVRVFSADGKEKEFKLTSTFLALQSLLSSYKLKDKEIFYTYLLLSNLEDNKTSILKSYYKLQF